MKKLTILFLCIVLCVVFALWWMIDSSAPAQQEDLHTMNTEQQMDSVVSQVEDLLPLLFELSEEETADLFLAEAIRHYILNEDGSLCNAEYACYPVLADGKVIAFADIIFAEEGPPHLTFGEAFAKELQAAVENTTQKFAIVYRGEYVIQIVFEDGSTKMIKDQENNPIGIADIDDSQLSFSTIAPYRKLVLE